MSARFLDTNILLRHLLNDDPIKSPACFALIQAIEQGRLSAWTSHLVIAEAVFVLSSRRTYNLSRDRVRDLLLPLIGLPGLKIPQKRLFGRIFELYTSLPIDFVDCYHATTLEVRGELDLYSYDAHFDQVPTVRRFEP